MKQQLICLKLRAIILICYTLCGNFEAIKIDFFTKQALSTFITGFRDPFAPAIRSMRPIKLTKILKFIAEEHNMQKSNHFSNKPAQFPQFNFRFPQHNYTSSQQTNEITLSFKQCQVQQFAKPLPTGPMSIIL